MAATKAKLGYGTLLKLGDAGNPETFTTVAENKTISGPNESRGFIEVTHMESPDGAKEYISDLLEGGEVTFTANFVNESAQNNVRAVFLTGELRNWQLIWPTKPTSKTANFSAIVTAMNPTAEVNSAMQLDVTLKLSGRADY